VRLAREQSTAAARTYGDNDINRTARAALNDKLVALAKNYQGYVARADKDIADSQRTNMIMLAALSALSAIALFGGLLIVVRSLVRSTAPPRSRDAQSRGRRGQ
jgi:methyl-accepting chemotaxis protein